MRGSGVDVVDLVVSVVPQNTEDGPVEHTPYAYEVPMAKAEQRLLVTPPQLDKTLLCFPADRRDGLVVMKRSYTVPGVEPHCFHFTPGHARGA